jgi:hypothetical protein
MKKIIFLLLIAYLTFNIENCLCQWVQVSNGIDGGRIKSLAISGGNMYAGTTGGGFYRSTDNGENWSLLFGMNNHDIICVRAEGNNVVCGTQTGGVYTSTNNGTNWTVPGNEAAWLYTVSVALLGNNIYAGTGDGLFISTNFGGSWSSCDFGYSGSSVYSVIAFPGYLFIGANGNGIFRSTNGGINWTHVMTYGVIQSLYKNGDSIYAVSSEGIFSSSDNGNSWNSISGNLPGFGYDITKCGNNIYVAGSGIYRSTNNGASWNSVNTGLTENNTLSIVSNNTTIFTGTETKGVFAADNANPVWIQKNAGLHSLTVSSMAGNGNDIYISVPSKGILISTNGGTLWTERINGLTNLNVSTIIFINNVLITGTTNFSVGFGVFRSTDFGLSWSNINSSPNFYRFCVDGNNNIYAASWSLSKSTDLGLSWTFYPGVSMAEYICKKGNYIFLGSQVYGVSRSSDFGITWDSVNRGFPNSYKYISSLFADSSYIYAGVSGSGLYVSSNDGLNWSSRNNGLTSPSVKCITKYNNYLFVGTDSGGVYISSNNGLSWIQKNNGLIPKTISSVYVKSGYLYAGTFCMGLWRRSFSEIIGVNNISSEIPHNFYLYQNYPNPFNPATSIKYQVESIKFIKLVVCDILGKEVATLVNEKQSPGTYEVTFDGSDFPSGVYFYTLETQNYRETKKMLLIK